MLRRQVAAVGCAVAGLMAAGLGPAVADDDAGWGDGSIWGSVDEQDSGDDGSDGSDSSDGSSDDYDSGSTLTPSGSGGGDSCDDGALTLEIAGLPGGCATAPALGDPADPGVVPVVVDAEDEAEKAFEQMALETANVHVAPGPPLPTYPNLETWIWVPRSQWQTLEMSVTAGATTVHVEARPVRIDIDSGERDQMKYSATAIDSTISCSGPGRVWRESLGDDAETSCDYTYLTTSADDPAGGDTYELTASIVYEGSWTCVGQCTSDGGSLGEAAGPTSSQSVEVQERQSVVVN
jgi:hypothetical protein